LGQRKAGVCDRDNPPRHGSIQGFRPVRRRSYHEEEHNVDPYQYSPCNPVYPELTQVRRRRSMRTATDRAIALVQALRVALAVIVVGLAVLIALT
jgi:hypothetical protein